MRQAPDFKCAPCNYVGPTEEFQEGQHHACPKCKSEDVYPHWMLLCSYCNSTHPLVDIFPEAELDLDPEVYVHDPVELEASKGCPTVLGKNLYTDDICGGKSFTVVEKPMT
jgi:hypothetical protein